MVYLMLFPGFEEMEAIAPLDLLRRAGVQVLTVGDGAVPGSHGIPIVADITVAEMDLTNLDMIIFPGGKGALAPAKACTAAMDALRFAHDNGKFTAAICAAPTVLAYAGVVDGRKYTCYPGFEDQMGDAVHVENAAVVRDGTLITGTSAGCAIPFGLALVEALKGKEAAQTVANQIVIR